MTSLTIAICLLVLIELTSCKAFSQQTHVLLDEEKVQVTRIDLTHGKTYVLTKDQVGTVWIALDPLVLTTDEKGQTNRKPVSKGYAATVNASVQIELAAGSSLPGRLIVVRPKIVQQELTVSPFILKDSLEDASDRNATLLVAISACRFRDTWNLADESKWVPSKPNIVVMEAGTVRWIRPGIHHFRTLGSSPARLVSIEW